MMNMDEFMHAIKTMFSCPRPLEINSDTSIISEKVYESHYSDCHEDEEVELNDTLLTSIMSKHYRKYSSG